MNILVIVVVIVVVLVLLGSALSVRNLQTLVEIGVDKNTTVVFPAPLMSTIAELGSFLAREQAAASPPSLPAANGTAVTSDRA
jgi:hypothetical protein